MGSAPGEGRRYSTCSGMAQVASGFWSLSKVRVHAACTTANSTPRLIRGQAKRNVWPCAYCAVQHHVYTYIRALQPQMETVGYIFRASPGPFNQKP